MRVGRIVGVLLALAVAGYLLFHVPAHRAFRFEAPAGNNALTLLIEEQRARIFPVQPKNHPGWAHEGVEITHGWVGWSRNGNRVVVLTCRQEFGSLISYHSLSTHNRPDPELDAKEVAEAGADLTKSLEHLAATSARMRSWDRLRKEGAVQWFCENEPEADLERFRVAGEKYMYRVPAGR